MVGKSWGSTFEQQVTGAESHDKSHHILSQKFIEKTGKLSLWAKIVGHLNHSRWWWPDLDHKVTCPTCPAWVPDPPCVGKALSDLTLFFAPLFGTNTLQLAQLPCSICTNIAYTRWFNWDRCVGKSSLTLSCFSSFQCFGNVGIKFPILCTRHVLRIPSKTW